jgi:hypothetical protein
MTKRDTSALFPFERTYLWRSAFDAKENDGESDVRSFYSAQLRSLRDKARALVDRIRTEMPYLTVHDITHLDALWEIGSLIAGPGYRLLRPRDFPSPATRSIA